MYTKFMMRFHSHSLHRIYFEYSKLLRIFWSITIPIQFIYYCCACIFDQWNLFSSHFTNWILQKNVLDLARIQMSCIKICCRYWAIGRAKRICQVQHLFSVGIECKNYVISYWCFDAILMHEPSVDDWLVLVVMCQKVMRRVSV